MTYEEGEEHFRNTTTKIIPRLYLGPKVFFRDLNEATAAESSGAVITSDPRDCLAFTTPQQVLFAAALYQGSSDPARTVDDVANVFELNDLLMQPIRTLSGGEAVRLALSKAFVAKLTSSTLTVCTPYSWLSKTNVKHLENLVSTYREGDRVIRLLSLEGQDDYSTFANSELPVSKTVNFKLTARDLTIPLELESELSDTVGSLCAVRDFEEELESPCLITGENGSGKSLVSKALSGAISHNGKLEIECSGIVGKARLLSQDLLGQVLGRTVDEILHERTVLDKREAQRIFEKLFAAFRGFYLKRGVPVPTIGPEIDTLPQSPVDQAFVASQPSVLQLKMALVASRLSSKPVALCIDEPEWGLTRSATAGFISAVIEISHSRSVPVLIASHRPWWDKVQRTKVMVERTTKDWSHPNPALFAVKLLVGGK